MPVAERGAEERSKAREFRADDNNSGNDGFAIGTSTKFSNARRKSSRIFSTARRRIFRLQKDTGQAVNSEHGDYWKDSMGRGVHGLSSAGTSESAE